MKAETGERVITPDLMPREALHYVSEGSEDADASPGDQTPAGAGKTKKSKRQGAAGKAAGGRVSVSQAHAPHSTTSKRASLHRGPADPSPAQPSTEGVQTAAHGSSAASR